MAALTLPFSSLPFPVDTLDAHCHSEERSDEESKILGLQQSYGFRFLTPLRCVRNDANLKCQLSQAKDDGQMANLHQAS